jgi:hypothetical protein
MCAERTIYTWVTVWRRTGSFKQQHGNTTRNRFKLSEKAQLMVREELDRNGQQTWEQLSHLIWVKTGETVSEYVTVSRCAPCHYLFISLLTLRCAQKNNPPRGQVARIPHHRGHN